MKIISWNMAGRHQPWRCLLDMDIDLALLQEACNPPPDVSERVQGNPAIEINPGPWETMIVEGRPKYRTAIVKLSNRIKVKWIEAKPLATAKYRDLVVSWPGTLAAALVTPPSGEPMIAVSMYAQWVSTSVLASAKHIVSDGSAHRVVSDVSTLITNANRHRILAAGDMNILRGHGERGDPYWAARYQTVFDRMAVMGLPCIGPEYPNGRQAEPWPDELPRDSRNVPTYHSGRVEGVVAELLPPQTRACACSRTRFLTWQVRSGWSSLLRPDSRCWQWEPPQDVLHPLPVHPAPAVAA